MCSAASGDCSELSETVSLVLKKHLYQNLGSIYVEVLDLLDFFIHFVDFGRWLEIKSGSLHVASCHKDGAECF